MITPFDKEGGLDEEVLKRHIDFLFAEGADGLAVCGSSGEFDALRQQERRRVIELSVQQAPGYVLAGVGGMATWDAVELAEYAQTVGADAVMALPPYYFGFGRDEVKQYYLDLAGSIDLPVMIYNNPGKTGIDVTPDLVAELHVEVPRICFIKESSSDIRRILEIDHLTQGGVKVFSGWDSLLLESLFVGCVGIISGSGNIVPATMRHLFSLVQAEDYRAAQAHYRLIRPLLVLLEDHGRLAAWLKAAVRLVHHDVGVPRPPYLPATEEEIERMRAALVAADCL